MRRAVGYRSTMASLVRRCFHSATSEARPKLFSATAPPTPEESAALVAGMPGLAGQPLPPPRFCDMGWREGQRFVEADDPDRTALPWTPPSFCLAADPSEQLARTTLQELQVPRGSFPGRFARVVRGALDADRCAELVASINDKGFTPALLNIGGGRQYLAPEARPLRESAQPGSTRIAGGLVSSDPSSALPSFARLLAQRWFCP